METLITNDLPKVIHYCWFGGHSLPPLAEKCIESWKKFLPDYEIKRWDESNFDVSIIRYTEQAYNAKKYAFVSDYARFWILYKYGGLYFDTDVEVIKNLDNIISRGPFMGIEKVNKNTGLPYVAPGLGLGATPKMEFYKDIIELYNSLSFINKDGTLNTKTIVEYTTELFYENGLKKEMNIQNVAGINIYPQEYFCPLHEVNHQKKLEITDNTYTIHWWAASWQPKSKEFFAKIKVILMKILGVKTTLWIIKKLKLREIRKMIGI